MDSSKTRSRAALIKACIANAKQLLKSAQINLDGGGSPASSYALATLALEEIGKAGFLRAGWVEDVTQTRLGSPKRLDDHLSKILFGLMGARTSRSKSHIEEFKDLQNFAKHIHQNRVGSTYAPTDDKGKLTKVSKAETLRLIQLVETRIALEESYKIAAPNTKHIEDANWLVTMFTDEQVKNFVFSKRSMEKLDELGDQRRWMEWIRQETIKLQQEAQARIAAEVSRITDPNDTKSSKWLITMRLFAPLHHIDTKALEDWNKWAPHMKLRTAGPKGKQELLVDLILPASVHVKDLWKVGFNFAQRLAIAFNIGAMGLIWWQKPHHQSVYYETIQDLGDKNWRLEVSEVGDFQKMFKKVKLPLGKDELWRAFQVFLHLPNGQSNTSKFRTFSLYNSALNFIGRANVFWPPFYNEAFSYLYLSLKEAFVAYKEMLPGETFAVAIERKFGGGKLAQDVKLDELIKWGESLTANPPLVPDQKFIPLEYIVNFKILVDAYYIKLFQCLTKKKMGKEKEKEAKSRKK